MLKDIPLVSSRLFSIIYLNSKYVLLLSSLIYEAYLLVVLSIINLIFGVPIIFTSSFTVKLKSNLVPILCVPFCPFTIFVIYGCFESIKIPERSETIKELFISLDTISFI